MSMSRWDYAMHELTNSHNETISRLADTITDRKMLPILKNGGLYRIGTLDELIIYVEYRENYVRPIRVMYTNKQTDGTEQWLDGTFDTLKNARMFVKLLVDGQFS